MFKGSYTTKSSTWPHYYSKCTQDTVGSHDTKNWRRNVLARFRRNYLMKHPTHKLETFLLGKLMFQAFERGALCSCSFCSYWAVLKNNGKDPTTTKNSTWPHYYTKCRYMRHSGIRGHQKVPTLKIGLFWGNGNICFLGKNYSGGNDTKKCQNWKLGCF